MKKIGFIILGFIGFIGIAAIIMTISLSRNMRTIRAIDIPNQELTNLSDGTFEGLYYYEDQIGATLSVTVENGKIVSIDIIEHIAGKGTIAEAITDDIIENQSLEVDDIAGATTSSHVIKLAISDALEE